MHSDSSKLTFLSAMTIFITDRVYFYSQSDIVIFLIEDKDLWPTWRDTNASPFRFSHSPGEKLNTTVRFIKARFLFIMTLNGHKRKCRRRKPCM